jgi:predicted metal-binding protein
MPRSDDLPRRNDDDADPSQTDFQFLENLSTAYWQSEVLFSALELRLFDHIESGQTTTREICALSGCREDLLCRILRVMKRMELIGESKGRWFNSQVAGRYLVSKNPSYMGNFFLYRRAMQENFRLLTRKISLNDETETMNRSRHSVASADTPEAAAADSGQDYAVRNFNYVRALDQLAREKARQIVDILLRETWEPPVLDLGGGAGTICRFLVAAISGSDRNKNIHSEAVNDLTEAPGDASEAFKGVLLDLPEVIEAARKIYPDETDWEGIETVKADFRYHAFEKKRTFGLIVMSNFLHAYGENEARKILEKALGLLKPGGKVLIHDYFPDRLGRNPQKGPLYDLAMMLNTYDGECHEASRVVSWLCDAGLRQSVVLDLETDSSLILAGEKLLRDHFVPLPLQWADIAISDGFRRAVPIPVEKIVTAPWVRLKCRYGCNGYGKNLQCPPNGRDDLETERLLGSYKWALLLEGAPPGRQFHHLLVSLEKKAFLSGLHKAFVLGAGPCMGCIKCPADGACKHSDLARPSMEASGIDVYQTAKAAGLYLAPVKQRGQYVKYIGLLLLE